jgi:hypothetical protein
VDASRRLLALARRHHGPRATFVHGDAADLLALAEVTPHAKGTTVSFHRPLAAYVNTLAEHGLLIDHLEELPDPDKEPGARADVPLFLALRARKVGS